MPLRRWIPAVLVAAAILATIPYGPVLRERLYRVGSPILLAESPVDAVLPLAATPARVAVGSDPVETFRTADLAPQGTWTPPAPCEGLAVSADGPRCAPPVTPSTGTRSQASQGGHRVLGFDDQVLVDSQAVALDGPALDLLIQRDVVHVAAGQAGLVTLRLTTGEPVYRVPGEAVALGGTDRTLVVAGGGRLRVFDMVPGKRRVVPGVGLALLALVPWGLRRAWRQGPRAVAWLALVAVAVGWKLQALQGIPIEAVHLLEFTAFGALVCRALAPGRAPWVAACGAALISLILGCCDETVQWWHPSRTGDIRDVWTDAMAGGFGALAAWKALGWTAPGTSLTALPRLAAVGVLSLAGFQHLVHGFGELRVDPVHGTWISRGSDVSAARTALQRDGDLAYSTFLRKHGKHSNPSAHEVRGRVYRRDFWLAREDLAIVCGEQGILEGAFPGVTAGTTFVLAPAEALRCDGVDSSAYTSPISGAALTALSPRGLWLAAGLAAVALLGLAHRLPDPVRGRYDGVPRR